MSQVLNIKNLYKNYGSVTAVNELSFDVEKGSIHGILGPNGSGKTTTLGIVLGIINTTGGEYRWFGEPPTHEHLKRIGALHETPNFYPYLSGEKNLKVVSKIKEADESNIPRVLQQVGLYN
ncbi:MAG: ATP-binding cassette domain-containing protein, partial [Flavobacteriales bacterium]